jgi:hypothetical protein
MYDRTRIAALASKVVASIPMVLPLSIPCCATWVSTNLNTAACMASSSHRRVRERVT